MALLHAAALWGLYAGPQRPSEQSVVTMVRVADVSPPTPAPPTLTPAPRQTEARQLQAQARADAGPSSARTSLLPSAATVTADVPAMTVPATAPVAGTLPSALGSESPTALAATGAVPGAKPGGGSAAALGTTPGVLASRVEGPSSVAEHLRNPRPPYPTQSRRLGEQGQVVLRVLVGEDGAPQKAHVHQTSGHDRLDRAALATVLAWRYVPGKRGGVPEAMWMDVPIQFVLE